MIKPFSANILLQRLTPYLISAMMLCITLGPTLKSIAIGVALAAILSTPTYKPQLSFIVSTPIFWAPVLIFITAVLACTWSIAPHAQQLNMLEKYSKLLYLPILAVAFSNKKIRAQSTQAFLLGMVITCICSFYKYAYDVPADPARFDPGKIFYNHIITSYMMAFAAYLAGLQCIRAKGLKKLPYLAMGLIFSIQILFVNMGRTGYVIYAMLMLLLLVQHFSLKKVRYGLVLVVISLMLLMYHSHNDVFTSRIQEMVVNIKDYQQGHQDSSIGFRLQFHRYAKSLFLAKPLLGQGTGSFTAHYLQDHPIPGWDEPLPDPHSQYWLIAAEFGVLGLVTLTCFFMSLIVISFRLVEMKFLLQALLLSFLLGNVSDALLVTSGIGYLFITFSALCLGEFVELFASTKRSTIWQPNGALEEQ